MKPFITYHPWHEDVIYYYLPMQQDTYPYVIADTIDHMDIPLRVEEVKVVSYREIDANVISKMAVFRIIFSFEVNGVYKLEDAVNKLMNERWI